MKTEMVKILLKNTGKIKTSFIQTIDDDHAYARKAWIEMGKPSSLSTAQVSRLEAVSASVKEPQATTLKKIFYLWNQVYQRKV